MGPAVGGAVETTSDLTSVKKPRSRSEKPAVLCYWMGSLVAEGGTAGIVVLVSSFVLPLAAVR